MLFHKKIRRHIAIIVHKDLARRFYFLQRHRIRVFKVDPWIIASLSWLCSGFLFLFYSFFFRFPYPRSYFGRTPQMSHSKKDTHSQSHHDNKHDNNDNSHIIVFVSDGKNGGVR